MNFWLMKSEPSDVSVDDVALRPEKKVPWYGVRNYQARNFMTREMNIGDPVFFYHSSCAEPGIVGIAQVASAAYPDETQFDPDSPYFDAKSSRNAPRWFNVDVRLLRKTRLISLQELRNCGELAKMRVLARGNRLSITPVTPAEWRFIVEHLLGLSPNEYG